MPVVRRTAGLHRAVAGAMPIAKAVGAEGFSFPERGLVAPPGGLINLDLRAIRDGAEMKSRKQRMLRAGYFITPAQRPLRSDDQGFLIGAAEMVGDHPGTSPGIVKVPPIFLSDIIGLQKSLSKRPVMLQGYFIFLRAPGGKIQR